MKFTLFALFIVYQGEIEPTAFAGSSGRVYSAWRTIEACEEAGQATQANAAKHGVAFSIDFFCAPISGESP